MGDRHGLIGRAAEGVGDLALDRRQRLVAKAQHRHELALRRDHRRHALQPLRRAVVRLHRLDLLADVAPRPRSGWRSCRRRQVGWRLGARPCSEATIVDVRHVVAQRGDGLAVEDRLDDEHDHHDDQHRDQRGARAADQQRAVVGAAPRARRAARRRLRGSYGGMGLVALVVEERQVGSLRRLVDRFLPHAPWPCAACKFRTGGARRCRIDVMDDERAPVDPFACPVPLIARRPQQPLDTDRAGALPAARADRRRRPRQRLDRPR